jgi:uncharacterized membrane protein
MPLLAIGATLVRIAQNRMPSLGRVEYLILHWDPVELVGLLAVLGLLCAVVGIRRNEHPKRIATIGLVANAAVPILFILLYVCAGLSLGGWLRE